MQVSRSEHFLNLTLHVFCLHGPWCGELCQVRSAPVDFNEKRALWAAHSLAHSSTGVHARYRYRHKVLSWKRGSLGKYQRDRFFIWVTQEPDQHYQKQPHLFQTQAVPSAWRLSRFTALRWAAVAAVTEAACGWVGWGTRQGTGNVPFLLLWMLPVYSAAISVTLLREKVAIQ